MSFIWIVLVIIFIWLVVLSFVFFRVLTSFKNISKSLKFTDLIDLKEKMDTRISFWNLYKFNPFNNTGGEQSFVLTLLDGHKNGIVMTVLNGRGVTRFYAKKIENGNSQQQLSAEEIKCIKDSL